MVHSCCSVLHSYIQVQHQDLKAAHNQLALTLEDHKSALAAAQVGQLHRDAVSLFTPVSGLMLNG